MPAGNNKGHKKLKDVGKNKQFHLHHFISQKNLTSSIFLLAPVANMFGTSLFLIGCMIWQNVVFWSRSAQPT